MELITVSLELAKEAAAEVTKEAVKATEAAAEFGKVGEVIKTRSEERRVGKECAI